nr:FixH family protein [Ardenticatena sp.]
MPKRMFLAILFLLGLTVACARRENSASVLANLSIMPGTVGTNDVRVQLSHVDNTPVVGAQVKVIGNMNHAGMEPSIASLTETAPGVYEGVIELTMPGEWFAIVEVTLESGETVELELPLPEVKRGE